MNEFLWTAGGSALVAMGMGTAPFLRKLALTFGVILIAQGIAA